MLDRYRTPSGDYEVYDGDTHVGSVFRSQHVSAMLITNWIPSVLIPGWPERKLTRCEALREALAMIERELNQLQVYRDNRGDVIVLRAGIQVGKILWRENHLDIDWFPMTYHNNLPGGTFTSLPPCGSLKEAVQSIERSLS